MKESARVVEDNSKESVGDAWGEDISDQRKTWLAGKLQAWDVDHKKKRGPFDGEKLTGADVFWLAARALADDSSAQAVINGSRRLRQPPSRADGGRRGIPNLDNLHLEGAHLTRAKLQDALLPGAHLEGATLNEAHLERAALLEAHLDEVSLTSAHLEFVDLSRASLRHAEMSGVHAEAALVSFAHLEDATLRDGHLEGAILWRTWLVSAELPGAFLQGAVLSQAHLEGADLSSARLNGVALSDTDFARISRWGWGRKVDAVLAGASLQEAFLDSGTKLNDATLGDASTGASLADVRWNGANLSVIDWSYPVHRRFGMGTLPIMLGDEHEAAKAVDVMGTAKSAKTRERDAVAAVRAYRQVAVILRAQGLHDDADRFAYHAQVLQRRLYRRHRRWLRWLFQWFLQGLAGYGYRPEFTLGWYVLAILISTAVYAWQGDVFARAQMPWYALVGTGLVDALTALHGRGFFPSPAESGWQMATAAVDAVVGLIIEASFIATFTQRFFAR